MRVLRTCQHPHLINLTPNLSHNFVLVLCRFVLLKKILCCPPYLTKGEWVLALTLSWTFQKISPFPSIRPAVRALRLPGCDGCCIFSIQIAKRRVRAGAGVSPFGGDYLRVAGIAALSSAASWIGGARAAVPGPGSRWDAVGDGFGRFAGLTNVQDGGEGWRTLPNALNKPVLVSKLFSCLVFSLV